VKNILSLLFFYLLFQLWRLGGWWIDCRGLMEMASRRWLISFTGWIALLMCFFFMFFVDFYSQCKTCFKLWITESIVDLGCHMLW
jgi:hypothetical protein